MIRTPFNLMDAATGMPINDQVALGFAQTNLTYVEPEVYRTRYPTTDYARHVPLDTSGAAWAQSSTWYSVDSQGEAKFISGQSTEIPFVGMTKVQYTSPFYMIGSGWTWNIEELNQAALTGTNLSAEGPADSRRVVERKLYDIAVSGATEKGWTGLINDATVTATDVASDGTGASPFWNTKTPDQILRDFNFALAAIPAATNNVEYADTVRLPSSAFDYLATTRLGSTTEMTILDWVRMKNLYTSRTRQELDIDVIPELGTIASGSHGRMIAYRKATEVVRFKLPMPFNLLPIRSRSLLSFEGAGITRTGGTQIRLPGAVRYLDQIITA